MKKFTVILLAFSMLLSLFTLSSCSKSDETPDLATTISEKIEAYKTDLEDSASTLTSNQKVMDYLCYWAESKDVKYTKDSHDNVIMKVKNNNAYKDVDPTVIICPYDSSQISNSIDEIAAGLYIAKNNENKSKITVIFTNNRGNRFEGIKYLNNKYFTDKTKVFSLTNGTKSLISMMSGAGSAYTFKDNIQYTVPTGEKAYRISVTGLPGGTPDAKISSYPNPIKECGSLLASFKTNSIIYQLSSFSSGKNGGTYPESASMTIVIDKDYEEKFTSKMESTVESFIDDNEDRYPDAKLTYREISLPDRVLTDSSCNDFVSLLYTLLDGVYYKDEEDNLVSITSLGMVKSTSNAYIVSGIAYSTSKQNLNEIDENQNTICSLSNTKYTKTFSQNLWTGKTDSTFATDFSTAYKEYTDDALEWEDCVQSSSATFIHEKNKKTDIVNIVLNDDSLEDITGVIITYLTTITQTEE